MIDHQKIDLAPWSPCVVERNTGVRIRNHTGSPFDNLQIFTSTLASEESFPGWETWEAFGDKLIGGFNPSEKY